MSQLVYSRNFHRAILNINIAAAILIGKLSCILAVYFHGAVVQAIRRCLNPVLQTTQLDGMDFNEKSFLA